MRKALLAALACASLAGGTPAFADDKAAIQAIDDQWSADANRGDGRALAALYSSDAAVLPPDNSVLRGAAIQAYFTGMFAHVDHAKLTATNVTRLSSNYIQEIGIATFMTKGDKPAAVTASYVVVWRKVNGAWKLWTDIFH